MTVSRQFIFLKFVPTLRIGRMTLALPSSSCRTYWVYPIEIESPMIKTLGSLGFIATPQLLVRLRLGVSGLLQPKQNVRAAIKTNDDMKVTF
jgi:hypothetical protein